MNIIIFGATGNAGKHLVKQALEKGHEVTAFSRNAQSPGINHPQLKIWQGNVLSAVDVADSVKGKDVILCALGAGRKGVVRSEGTLNIIKGMKKHGIKRLVCQTTLGCGDSKGNLDFFWKYIMFGWFLKAAFLDHELQEKYIIESNLDWTIVRPGAFTDGEITRKFKSGFSATDKNIKLKISKADLAYFMLNQVDDEKSIGKAISLSY